MRILKFCAVAILFLTCLLSTASVYAQCAMCSLNAENSVQHGNTHGKGLNDGIMYLLAAPYIAVAVIGYIWYKSYRKKSALVDTKEEKIRFN